MNSKWFVCIALFALDLLSKVGALYWIPPLRWGEFPFGGIPVFANFFGVSFSLNTIVNTGAAWGIFHEFPGVLFLIRLLFVLAIGCYIYFFQRAWLKVSFLWLIAIGALGNALDYLFYGHVIDFIHFVFWGYSYPIFNFADIYISLGVLGLLFVRLPQSETV